MPPLLHSAWLGLGSNLGQSRLLLREAWSVLNEQPDIEVQQLSAPYRTRPVAMESPHWFVNAVGLLKTGLSPEQLLRVLLAVEEQFGRIRITGCSEYQDRTLDLDLLLYDDLTLESSTLTLPHPLMHKRLFVLVPLAEISRSLLHPLKNKTIAELLADLQSSNEDGQDTEQLSW